MLELGLRESWNLKQMDFRKYSFQELAFKLNVTSKSENDTFLKLHEFVSLLKLDSSHNVA